MYVGMRHIILQIGRLVKLYCGHLYLHLTVIAYVVDFVTCMVCGNWYVVSRTFIYTMRCSSFNRGFKIKTCSTGFTQKL